MKKIFWIIIPVLLVLALFPFFKGDDDSFRKNFENEIESRKRFLQFNDESPFKEFDIPYKAPEYFDYDSKFRVQAKIERIEKRELVVLQNSQGNPEKYLKHSKLIFSLDGKTHELIVLKPFGFGAMDVFFLAFADETSNESTYGGGRYIDVQIGKSNKLTLDFNYAYNPYCAYVPEYECPLPPEENILPIKILAGEKIFKK